MRKAYILIYSNDIGTQKEITDYLDTIPEIINWRIELPNTIFIVSQLSAQELADKFRLFTKDKGKFIISEVTSNKQGWLTRKTWDVINNKPDPQ